MPGDVEGGKPARAAQELEEDEPVLGGRVARAELDVGARAPVDVRARPSGRAGSAAPRRGRSVRTTFPVTPKRSGLK